MAVSTSPEFFLPNGNVEIVFFVSVFLIQNLSTRPTVLNSAD